MHATTRGKEVHRSAITGPDTRLTAEALLLLLRRYCAR